MSSEPISPAIAALIAEQLLPPDDAPPPQLRRRAISYFWLSTGEIFGMESRAPGDEMTGIASGVGWTEGALNGDTHWHDGNGVVQCGAFPVTVLPGLITGIPVGTLAHWNGHRSAVDDGELGFAGSMGLEQTVRVWLQHPAYLDWHGDVICPALN